MIHNKYTQPFPSLSIMGLDETQTESYLTHGFNILCDIEREYAKYDNFASGKLWLVKKVKEKTGYALRFSKIIVDIMCLNDIYVFDSSGRYLKINNSRNLLQTSADFIFLAHGGSLNELTIKRTLELL